MLKLHGTNIWVRAVLFSYSVISWHLLGPRFCLKQTGMKGVGGGHFRACFINNSIMAGLKLAILVPYHTFTLAIQYSIIFAGAKNHQLGLFIYCYLQLTYIVLCLLITFICL